jgi:hypothetical protein
MAVACLTVFAADQARLAQMPIVDCAGPEAGCAFSEITAADVRLLEAAGLSRTLLAAAAQMLAVIARLSLPLVGALLFWRRPTDWVAWCLSLAFLSVLTEGAAGLGRLTPLAQAALAVGVLAWLPVPFIFPNGRLEPRRLRWPIAVFMGVAVVAWTPPVGTRLLPAEPLAWLNVAVGLAWAALSGYSLIYRYRFVSTVVERQQTKWVIAGFVALFFTTTTYVVAAALFPAWEPSPGRLVAMAVSAITYPVGYGAFAAALTTAILRHRLWDIDIVIRRTLVYATLTALLALVYFGAVTVIQQVLHSLTLQAGNGSIIVSTLLTAALFHPLRRRVQQTIDRRFYRRKYDMTQTLAAFAAVARDNTDLDALAARLEMVVHDTLQPAHSSLWLRPPDFPANVK